MKFGSSLKSQRYDDWAPNYIDYSDLKKELKNRLHNRQWDDADEAEFVGLLLRELGKVSRFQREQLDGVLERLERYTKEVEAILEQTGPAPTASRDEEEAEDSDYSIGDVPQSVRDQEREEAFDDLGDEMQELIADVFELDKFTHLNYTGFIKIVKKHDKRTGWDLRRDFMRRHLQKAPFYKFNFDSVIVKVSKLFNIISTRGNPVKGDSAAGGGQTAFVRSTTKYWVHPDNYVQLKLAVLRYLPVLQFKEKTKFDPEDAAISSIYFDNPDLELYIGRLEKTQGALAIRLRWYGSMSQKVIYVERKTHREDWTGEKSVKDRFPIQEHNVDAYLRGEHIMDDDPFLKTQAKGASDLKTWIKMAREVQDAIKTLKLQPVMRTFYNRTAFQLPGDARVRISFDTNLTLVREDNWDGGVRSGSHWRRMDIGIDWPFDQLSTDDKHLFPYGVLEVKLALPEGEDTPDWVTQLVGSHLVEAVPKFSKFIHGCATLLPNRVDLVPFWLPQMEIDIRKPVNEAQKAALIERPTTSNNTTSATATSASSPAKPASDVDEPAGYTEPISDGEDDDDDERMHPAADESGVVGLTDSHRAAVAEARDHRQRHNELEREKRSRQPNGLDPSHAVGSARSAGGMPAKLTINNLKMLLAAKQEGIDRANAEAEAGGVDGAGVETVMVSSFKAPLGKMVSGKVRVEPKVYFANERTYLGWMEFATLLSAIGIGILNFVPEEDPVGLAAGIVFTVVALSTILYGTYMFFHRAKSIRRRLVIRYDDRFGPSVLVGILVLALLTNVVLRFTEGAHSQTRGPKRHKAFATLANSSLEVALPNMGSPVEPIAVAAI